MLEIKDHVALAREDPTDANIEKLWRAVFRLQAWYFLPARDVEGPSSPLVVENDDGVWLLVFTDFRRLSAFASELGRRTQDGSVRMLVLDPRQSMEQVHAVSDHIEGVLFNPGDAATFRAPVDALSAYAGHFGLDN